MPLLPRAKVSEAVRAGVFSSFIPKKHVHGKYEAGKYVTTSDEVVKKQIAARVAASKERLTAKMSSMGYSDTLSPAKGGRQKG